MKKMKFSLWARLFSFFLMWQLALSTGLAFSAEWDKSLTLEVVPVLARVGRIDCNGVKGGFAYLDGCGICVGGNTGKTPCVVWRPRLSDTGQVRDYITTFGEDSDYTINPPSYSNNHDGTVTDNVTGLMWQQNSTDGGGAYSWYQAAGAYDAFFNPTTQNVCASQNTGGHTDWRLPTRKELGGIVDYGRSSPSIDPIFTHNDYLYYGYWSSTTYAVSSSHNAWFVVFSDGTDAIGSKEGPLYVRCVRGGQ